MVSNSTRGKRERIGRILRMHANKREELNEADAGNIYAAVGLRDTRTGDTLCDEKKPIVLEKMIFPEPVISIAIEPKTKADVDKLGIGLQKLAAEDPSFRIYTDEETGQTIICRHGRAPPRDHRRPPQARVQGRVERRQARGRVPRGDHQAGEVRVQVRASSPAVAASTVTCCIEITPGERGTGYVFENDIVGGVIPKEFIPAIEKGVRDAMERGVLAGYPMVDVQLPPLRRQLPRRRLERAGVRNRRLRSASRTAPRRPG